MAGDEQEREGAGSIPERKPANRVVRDKFNTVEKSAGLPGGRIAAFAAIGLVVATAAAGFVAFEAGGGSAGPETVSAPAQPAEPAFRSRVASACNVGWKDDRLNRDQIHCWLTRDVLRLCDVRERAALVGRLVDYEAAKERRDGHLGAAALRMAFNPDVMAMGWAYARSTDTRLSEEQRQAEAEKTMSLSQSINAPANKVLEESNNETAQGITIQDFAELAEAGYLIPEDFPDPMPGLAAKGFAAAAPARAKPCKR